MVREISRTRRACQRANAKIYAMLPENWEAFIDRRLGKYLKRGTVGSARLTANKRARLLLLLDDHPRNRRGESLAFPKHRAQVDAEEDESADLYSTGEDHDDVRGGDGEHEVIVARPLLAGQCMVSVT